MDRIAVCGVDLGDGGGGGGKGGGNKLSSSIKSEELLGSVSTRFSKRLSQRCSWKIQVFLNVIPRP